MTHRILSIILLIMMYSCSETKVTYTSFDDYPTPIDKDLWLDYSKNESVFRLWSPTAAAVQVLLYAKGDGGEPLEIHALNGIGDGSWERQLRGDLHGTYYTFRVNIDGEWQEETPGIYAKAVGVNGKRAMVLDFETTNPPDWERDKGPSIKYTNEAIIYELHIRDMTIHPQSGSSAAGKYLGLTEPETKGPNGTATGFDHLKEMGITHVHLLPTYDHYSINEAKLDSLQFNWGYDPQNYNVPEGSFASDPFKAEVRVKEFKQMVKAFHDSGIGVILDVVYNHTGRTENSNFNLEVPGYYYRHWEDGRLADASACGNETASERAMMRKFMIESMVYWAQEYHLDGFRVDLMGIHDTETMNEVVKAVKQVNNEVFIYGEGWTAGDSPLPMGQRAVKANVSKMPEITAFGDELRDGLKGSVFEDNSTGFVSGAQNTEESIKYGVVGGIQHPQLNYEAVNYTDDPWAVEPWQSIAYVSCHDNHTLYDKLKVSRPDASENALKQMDKLANAVVMTSQGTAFIHAGAEMLRTKNGEHNSYNLPDSINRIDWNWKVANEEVVDYYKNLIKLRKAHPGFRMPSALEVRGKLKFKTVEPGLVSFQISDHANGDVWKNIYVIYNARTASVNYNLEGEWRLAVVGDTFYNSEENLTQGSLNVPAITMAVLYQE